MFLTSSPLTATSLSKKHLSKEHTTVVPLKWPQCRWGRSNGCQIRIRRSAIPFPKTQQESPNNSIHSSTNLQISPAITVAISKEVLSWAEKIISLSNSVLIHFIPDGANELAPQDLATSKNWTIPSCRLRYLLR